MTKSKKFIVNGAVTTLTALILRLIGVSFNSYLSGKLGSEGMGIYTLIESVYLFALTFASSGIALGTTRLVSEANATGDVYSAQKSVRTAFVYALFFSLSSSVALFFLSPFIGIKLLCDARTVLSLKVLAFSLPFVSLSSVLNGYFTAVRRPYKSSASAVFESFVNILIIVRLMVVFAAEDLETACAAVAAGTVASEFLSLSLSYLLYRKDAKKIKGISTENRSLMKKLVGISLPLALSAYARQGLVTVEHLLIPYGLKKHGLSSAEALSSYGLVHGMAFPVIMFPSCVVYSFASLIVPEMAEYRERGEKDKIDDLASKMIRYALLFSIGVAGIMTYYSYDLSLAVYSSPDTYRYIKIFAPLICVMYLDATVDGMLKGLNEQLYSMKVNIADALLSVLAVYFLTPHFGIFGYVLAVFICEIFNCALSLIRLVSVCRIRLDVLNDLIFPVLFALFSVSVSETLSSKIIPFAFSGAVGLVFRIVFSVFLYCAPLFIRKSAKARKRKLTY